MRTLLLFILILSSCSTSIESTDDLVNRLEKAMKANDTKAIENCFVSTKKEIKAIYNIASSSHPIEKKSDIEKVYQEYVDEMGNVPEYLFKNVGNDWSTVVRDSISHEDVGKRIKENLPEGFRIDILYIHYKNKGVPFQMQLELIDCNTGKWKIIDRPRIFK